MNIPLSGKRGAGLFAIIDDSDYSLVSRYKWHLSTKGYAKANPQRTTIYMHRLIAGFPGADHINHEKLDNRRSNLRRATAGQNMANKIGIGRSGYKGVYPVEGREGFKAICAKQYLGYFKTKIEAAKAYDQAALSRWGEFALLNFPIDGAALL